MAGYTGKYVGGKIATKPQPPISPCHLGGSVRLLHDVAALPANMAINDYVDLGELSSNTCISRALSKFFFDVAGTAGSKWNIGTDDVGQSACIAANIDAATVIAAGQNAMNIGLGNDGKRLWELAGFAADTKRKHKIRVTLTGAAGPATAFNMALELYHKH